MNLAPLVLVWGLVLLVLLASAAQGASIQRAAPVRRAAVPGRSGKASPYSALVCYYYKGGVTRTFQERRCRVGEVCLDYWDGEHHGNSCATPARCRQLKKARLPWVRCCDQDLCNG